MAKSGRISKEDLAIACGVLGLLLVIMLFVLWNRGTTRTRLPGMMLQQLRKTGENPAAQAALEEALDDYGIDGLPEIGSIVSIGMVAAIGLGIVGYALGGPLYAIAGVAIGAIGGGAVTAWWITKEDEKKLWAAEQQALAGELPETVPPYGSGGGS